MTVRRRITNYSVIILIVTAVQPVLFATEPQNQDQHGTGLSQTGTKSIVSSDPCDSFRESSSEDPLARPEAGKSQTGVKVIVSPHTNTHLAVGYSLRLTATVTGATDTTVEWAVAGPGCSGPACGLISGAVYLAPTVPPKPPIVRVTATSKADPRASDSTIVCVVQPRSGLIKWAPPLSAAASISAAARQSALNSSAVVGRNDYADLKP